MRFCILLPERENLEIERFKHDFGFLEGIWYSYNYNNKIAPLFRPKCEFYRRHWSRDNVHIINPVWVTRSSF